MVFFKEKSENAELLLGWWWMKYLLVEFCKYYLKARRR